MISVVVGLPSKVVVELVILMGNLRGADSWWVVSVFHVKGERISYAVHFSREMTLKCLP